MKVIYAEVIQRYQGSIKVVVSKNLNTSVDNEKYFKNESEFGLYSKSV